LILNRGSGFFFAGAKLEGIDPDFDTGFIQRNHAKAKLALGDAVLAANGLYRCSCRERERLITGRIPGVLFKFSPCHEKMPREELERQQRDLVVLWSAAFLWLEGRRLGREFKDLGKYARRRTRVLPEFPLWKNIATRGVLQRALAAYLSAAPGTIDLRAGARILGVSEENSFETYRRWWARYN
jgi:hypothetical protein